MARDSRKLLGKANRKSSSEENATPRSAEANAILEILWLFPSTPS